MKEKLENYKKLFAILHETCNKILPLQKEIPEAFPLGWNLLQIMKVLQNKIAELEKEAYSNKDNVIPFKKKDKK